MPRKESIKLSPGEMELLELLWEQGELTIADTHKLFLEKGKQIGYSTVQTRLNRLVDKQLIRREGEYPAVYRAVLRREDVSGKYFDLLEELCGGNIIPLMLHLSKKRKFQPSELEVLRSILDDNLPEDQAGITIDNHATNKSQERKSKS